MKERVPQVGDPDFVLPLKKDRLRVGEKIDRRLPRLITLAVGNKKEVGFQHVKQEIQKLVALLPAVEALILKDGGDPNRLTLFHDSYMGSTIWQHRIMRPHEIEKFMQREMIKLEKKKRAEARRIKQKEMEKKRREKELAERKRREWERTHAEEAKQQKLLMKIRMAKRALTLLKKQQAENQKKITMKIGRGSSKNTNQHKRKV